MASVIDLGCLDGRETLTPVPRRGLRHRTEIRGLAFIVVVVLTLLLGGGVRAAETRFARQLIRIGENAGFTLADSALYVRSSGNDAITAYTQQGRRLWTARLKLLAISSGIVPAGDVVLVAEDCAGASRTAALDARTGRRLWREPGRPLTANHGAGLAVVVIDRPDANRDALIEPPSFVSGLDLRTGRVRWAYGIGLAGGVSAALIVQSQAPRKVAAVAMVVFDSVRNARLVDFHTGATTPVDTLPPSLIGNLTVRLGTVFAAVTPLRASTDSLRDAQVVGPFGLRWTVQAYGVQTLQPTWETTLDAGPFVFKPCGDLICATGGGQVHALDPQTGEVRWRAAWSYASSDAEADRDTRDSRGPKPGGVAVAVADATSGSPKIGLIDVRTGRTVANVGRWSPVGEIGAAWVPLTRPARHSSPHTEVAVLDRDGGKVHALGEFLGPGTSCQANGRRLACATTDGDLAVWRYRQQ